MAIFLLAILAAVFFSICMIYIVDNDHNMYMPFVILLIILMFISSVIGYKTSNKKEVKKPIAPSLHIECNSSKCDTTYVYNFK